MSSRRWLVWIGSAFVAALAISAALYGRSRSANFDGHGRVLEAIGRVRALDRQLSEQVLAARFGLLNQYDAINATEDDLRAAREALATRLKETTPVDGTLASALHALEASVADKCAAAERFKTENSVLRNSTYYLPTAANDLAARLATAEGTAADDRSLQRVAQTGLAYNLIGDESAREAHARAIETLKARKREAPEALQGPLALLVAHAEAIAREVPAVDQWVEKVTAAAVAEDVLAVQREDGARFDVLVALSNRYRLVLYGWSLVLLCAVGAAGVQLQRAYAGLEAKVVERTAELRKAVDALWGEMKLARKIQEALVPAAPMLGGCEVAARMRATEEVGGDYYDVIRLDGCDWILIGDVSGHGVSAGLVMMMCHTAVRTALASRHAVGPDALLAMVNSVLTENIRQLGEDKYMTICAFRRTPDGCVAFAGAHQDVQIYRAATASIETLPSKGIWLGLQSDIAASLVPQEIRMAPGDQLLLHTDGVTEATKDGRMFDVQGLCQTFRDAATGSADDVLEHIFSTLKSYHVTDDATVVVLKQL